MPSSIVDRIAARGIVSSLFVIAACSNGGSGADPAPTPLPPALHGAIYLGGGATKATRDFTVRAVDQHGNEWTRAESKSCRHFDLHHDDWDAFVGRIEAAVEVATPTGPQTVTLARDFDLTAAAPALAGLGSSEPAVLPHAWIGPVSTVASRYRATHAEVTIAAAERLAAEHLGVVTANSGTDGANSRDLHTSFGHSLRSPFVWSQFLADAGAESLDDALDAVVAELGTATPPRNHRTPHPYPVLGSALGGGIGAGNPNLPWKEGEFKDWLYKGMGEDAHYLTTATVAGTILAKLGFGQDPSADYLAALQQLDAEVLALQSAAIGSSYEIAWRNAVESVNPACTRVLAVHNQYATYITPGIAAAQQAALALRDYSRHAPGGMTQDFITIRDALVGRATTNGPLASIYAGHLMLDRCGITNPRPDLLGLELRKNEWLDELQQVQHYYLGCLFLSMHLHMEYANLDPYTFPMVGGTGNSMAARINLVNQLAFGDALATPPTPGFFADVVAVEQLAPAPTIGHDDILIDCVATSTSNPTSWYLDASHIYSVNPAYSDFIGPFEQSFALGPWPAGSFRRPTVYELQQLRSRAMTAGMNNVRDGLVKLGFQIPAASGDEWVIPYQWVSPTGAAFVGPGFYYDIETDTQQIYVGTGRHRLGPMLVRAAPGSSEDAGTTVACAVPMDIAGQGPNSFAIDYQVWDPQGWATHTGTQEQVMTVTPATAPTAGFLTRSRIVWQFDPPTAPYRVINGMDDVAHPPVPPDVSAPFVQYLVPIVTPAPDPSTVTLVGQIYTGYQGPPGSIGNQRAAPLSVRVPLTTLQQQPGMPNLNSTPILSSLWAVPRGLVFTNPNTTPFVDCYATGFTKDASGWPAQVFDFTSSTTIGTAPVTVAWSVTSQSGLARFATGTPNRLLLDAAQGTETMTITVTATYAGVTVSDTATCYTNF